MKKKNKKKNFSFFVIKILLLLAVQVSVFAATTMGTLLQTIDTSVFNPPSPDPSGLAFLGSSILDCDGEVNEMPIYMDANFFEMTLSGVLLSTGDSTSFSDEPVGCAFNTDNGNLFVSDDNRKEIYEIHPGTDGQLFTVDDIVVNIIDTLSFGNGDPEGVAYGNGALFSVDGVSNEAYKLLPGEDGRFGTEDDVVTHFDTLSLGITDPEGIAYDPDHPEHLYIVGSERNSTLFGHVTTNGTLVRTIDYAPAATLFPAGVTAVSQAITGDNTTHVYISDRGVDNNDDPNENDGLIFKVSVPLFNGNQAPSVAVGADQIIDVSLSAILDGTVVDDGIPSPPEMLTTTWSQINGPAPVSFADSNSVDTTVSFTAIGDYQLRLTADDSILAGSDDIQIIVTEIPPPFTYTYISTLSEGIVGNVAFADEDIIVYNEITASWSMYFDGSDVGLGATEVDAFQLMPDSSILLSFSTDEVLVMDAMSNTLSIDSSDIVRFIPAVLGDNTAGIFEWYFDGSDVGLDTSSENIDAIGFTADGKLVISSSGSLNVPGASGNAEDLLAFTAISLGETTNGTWQKLLDGLDVGLGDVVSEDVNGVWINDINGDIHLSTKGVFSVTGVSGDGADIFKCIPGSTGDDTVCNSYGLTWNGIAHGLPTGVVVNAIGMDDGSGNTFPLVTISTPIDETSFVAGELVTFAASAADAEDDNAILTSTLSWDSSIDGVIGSGTNVNTSALSVGVHTITASVVDSGGLDGLESINITINPEGGENTFPIISISSPLDGTAFDEGISVNFSAGVIDAEDDDATLTSALSWISSLDGHIGSGSSFNTSVLSVGTHSITASVTDSGGLTGMNSIIVTINLVGGGNTVPTVTIGSPMNGASFDETELVVFTGSVIDAEDDDATLTMALTWISSLDGFIGNGGSLSSSMLSLGTHAITASVTDSGGLSSSNSISVTIIPSNGVTIIEVPVKNSMDDAEERLLSGFMSNITRNTLAMTVNDGDDQIVGMRFTQVFIPQGATILNAYLQFTSAGIDTSNPALQIWGQDEDYAAIFSTDSGDISSRPKTSVSVPWDPVPWTTVGDAGIDQRTPNIAVVIQEIVNRTNWVNGSSMVVMVTGDGNGSRHVSAYTDYAPTVAPMLHVEYDLPVNTSPTVSISSPLDGTDFTTGDLVTFTGYAMDTEDDDATLSSALFWTSSLDGTIGSGAMLDTSTLSEGVHTITVSVTDSGDLSSSDSISITINPSSVITIIDVPVKNSMDDAEERLVSGLMSNIARNTLAMTVNDGDDQIVGTRFTQVAIPQGATILNAYLQFTSSRTDSTTTTLQIWGQDSDDAQIFSTEPANISSRPITSVSVPWDPVPWTIVGDSGIDQRTPNIAVVIQEIVDRANWVSGNSLVVMITGDGNGKRRASAYTNYAPDGAPQLHIEYDQSGNTAPTVSISSPSDGTVYSPGDLVTFIGSATDTEDNNTVLSSALIWRSSLDGVIGSGTMLGTSTLSVGVHTMTASVTDTGGLTGANSIIITVMDPVNTVPVVSISDPVDGTTFMAGDLVTFIGSATDAEDDDAMLSSALVWTSSLDGVIGNGAILGTSTLSVGVHTMTASVTDAGGLTGTNSITITVMADPVNTVPVVSISDPFDGTAFLAGDLITFIGSATDTEDDDAMLSSALIWTSSLDGVIGSGAVLGISTLSVGVHTITASVTDSGGLNSSDLIAVTINPSSGITILEVSVKDSMDDAEERLVSGLMSNIARNTLAMTVNDGDDQIVGTRFTQVAIPQGATILNAYLQFTSSRTDTTPTILQIWGQDSDDAQIFTTEPANISSRPISSVSVHWNPVPWTIVGDSGIDQRTPNIAVVIQEIINRTNWVSGNSLVVMITGDGNGKRRASAYTNYAPAGAPRLHIEYE